MRVNACTFRCGLPCCMVIGVWRYLRIATGKACTFLFVVCLQKEFKDNGNLKKISMKKFLLSAVLAVICSSAFAQFNVGSSTTGGTDMFGNTVTTHRDSYGRTTGTSTTGGTDTGGTDMFGNTVTTHRDSYGRTTGTSTTSGTDMFGNTVTTHRDSYGRTTGTSTTGSTDMFGNTITQQSSNSGGTSIWTW